MQSLILAEQIIALRQELSRTPRTLAAREYREALALQIRVLQDKQ